MGKLYICRLVYSCIRTCNVGFTIVLRGEPGTLAPKLKSKGNRHLHIRSFNYDWTKEWAHAVLQVLSSTKNQKKVWAHAAQTADDINRRILEGKSPAHSYSCLGPSCLELRHSCQGCGRSTPCALLSTSALGLLECGPCINKGWGGDGEKVLQVLVRHVSFALRYEFASLPSTATSALKDELQDEIERTRKYLLQSYSKLDKGLVLYFNLFTGTWIQPFPNGDRPDATGCSIDSIWPLAAINTESQVALHVPGNVCFTYLCLNLGKRTDLPIFLHYIGRFCRERHRLLPELSSDDPAALHELDTLETELVRNCHRATYIRDRTPRRRKSRIAARKHLTQEMYDYLMEEWVSGKLHPGGEYIQRQSTHVHDLLKPGYMGGWNQHEISRIKRTVTSIQEYTGIVLPVINDCPVFAHLATVSPGWSWDSVHYLLRRHLAVMTKFCNKWWETVETTETLLLECIFQVSIRKMVVAADDPLGDTKRSQRRDYEELLGLPLVAGMNNGLRFSVAHRVHSMQMLTGWKREPTSLDDRNDARNNILIESCISNYAKSHFDPSVYPHIQKCFREIKMPSQLVQEELVPTRCDRQLEQRIAQAFVAARQSFASSDTESESDEEEEWNSESDSEGEGWTTESDGAADDDVEIGDDEDMEDTS